MSNIKFEQESQYFSGQGVALMGVLDRTTKALLGYEPLGNVSDLKLQMGTTVLEHKSSQDGQRATDKRLQTAVSCKASITLESFKPSNIARALRGRSSKVVAATGVAAALSLLPGLVGPLGKIKVSNVAVQGPGAVTLTDFTTDTAPWDYRVNADAGSIQLNDGSTGVFPDKMGLVPTAVTVGATTSITVANTYSVGEEVLLWGFTGTNAADLNGKKTKAITGTNGTTLVVAINTTAKTITTAAGTRVMSIEAPIAVAATFDHAEQHTSEALTEGLTEVPLRFEGLNTATDNSPVVIDVWKFSTDPLKELALISDTIGQMVLEGSVLADNSKTTTSKYFRVTKLNE
jgi:hypothetical protein